MNNFPSIFKHFEQTMVMSGIMFHSYQTLHHRNSSEWLDVWMKGDANSERLEKHPLREQLTIKKLKSSDEGTYKVLDENGLAVSTVQLSVEGERPVLPPGPLVDASIG